MDQQFNWIVSQIGSREYYAVPRAFHARGHLQRLYTDIWSGRAAPFLLRAGRRPASLAHRSHPEIPRHKARAFTASSLLFLLRERLGGKPKDMAEIYEQYDRIGRHFALNVNAALRHETLDPQTAAAFLFSTGALETCEYLRTCGIPIIVDQLDPARLDEQSVRAEMEKFPGWEELPGRVPESYYQRLAEEWRLADRVLVNSNWSRQNLLNEKVEPEKIIVVPLCYEPKQEINAPRISTGDAPLTVLWIGQVLLRKGIQYLFEAARRMQSSQIRFLVAGRIGVSQKAIDSAPPNVEILGKVSRAKALELFGNSDLFVLPTVSDGFALTQLEALSFGLPVLTTSHCGDVVSEGIDGHILPCGNVDALVAAIERLERDRGLLAEMKANAVKKPREPRFSLDGYADAVENAMSQVRAALQTKKLSRLH